MICCKLQNHVEILIIIQPKRLFKLYKSVMGLWFEQSCAWLRLRLRLPRKLAQFLLGLFASSFKSVIPPVLLVPDYLSLQRLQSEIVVDKNSLLLSPFTHLVLTETHYYNYITTRGVYARSIGFNTTTLQLSLFK